VTSSEEHWHLSLESTDSGANRSAIVLNKQRNYFQQAVAAKFTVELEDNCETQAINNVSMQQLNET
jgi:hypothetical protein